MDKNKCTALALKIKLKVQTFISFLSLLLKFPSVTFSDSHFNCFKIKHLNTEAM